MIIVGRPSLLKLVDELILPTIIIIATRYFGIFVAGLTFQISFGFSLRSDLLSAPFIDFGAEADLLTANLVSWALVSVVLVVIFGFVLFRNLHFHKDWIHPKETTYLHNKNLEFMIIPAEEAFHQGFSWCLLSL